jgi:hypothetical protein
LEFKTRKKRVRPESVGYGAVVVTSGPHKGRIGEYDDDEGTKAIVYFGSPLFASGYHLIPLRHLAQVTTVDLMTRLDELFGLIGLKARVTGGGIPLTPEHHIELLNELVIVQDILADRIFTARFVPSGEGRSVFISHSSNDKRFARWLAIDLANAGHRPWLDEWEILAGESIPSRISDGVSGCDFVVVVLSEHAVRSNWVEREWQAKYWDEVSAGQVKVIPALFNTCEIPTLLKAKRYADFTADLKGGFETLLAALSGERRRS